MVIFNFLCAVIENSIEELKKRLKTPQDIVIITHRNPDGDALGSSLALSLFLQQYFHKVDIILPSDYPQSFGFLPQVEKCKVYDLEPELCLDTISKASIVCCLDFNSLDRIDKMGESVEASNAFKVLIDHHMHPEPFADYTLSETTASSTCELIYTFIELLGETKRISEDIATAMFTGLITDTGSFKYATTDRTFEVAAHLKRHGVDDYSLQDKIFNTYSEKQMRLLGHCIYNRMELLPQYHTGIITLTKADYEEYSIERGDTEGIVNYLLMLDGIKVAAFITEQPTIVKLSLRSKGDFSVQEIASKHFKGGGHKNASGGSAYAKLSAVVDRFKSVLPQYAEKYFGTESE